MASFTINNFVVGTRQHRKRKRKKTEGLPNRTLFRGKLRAPITCRRSMQSLATLPSPTMTEPLVAEPSEYVRRKIRQYRIISIMFFLLVVILVLLLACSVLFGFGCTAKNTAASGAEPTITNFIHVSDVHLDVYYNHSTSKKSFCRSMPNTLNITPAAAPFDGLFGRVGCDSPHALVHSALSFMKNLSSNTYKAKFLVLTGDQVAHRMDKGFVKGTTKERVLSTINITSSAMKSMFSDIPLLPSMGNNDLPGDYVLPKDDSFYKSLLKIWKPLIICDKCASKVTTEEELKKTFHAGGYYKAEIKDDKLVLLQLNTNYWSGQCINLNPGPRTLSIADGQMQWLTAQLKEAKDQDKVVIITGHIPPGIDGYSAGSHGSFWPKNYTQKYIEMVTKTYKDVVIGQLFGHIHKDDMRFQRLNEDKFDGYSSFLLTAPGITPLYRNNPGFRLVSFDKEKQLLTNYDQYYMDLVLSTQNKKPTWMFDYSFGDKYLSYVPKEERAITGKAMHNIVESLIDEKDRNSHWQVYIQHRQVNYQPDPYNRYKLYCVVKYAMKEAFDECAKRFPVTGG